jgi:putative membrane protein insertion efficiency factor
MDMSNWKPPDKPIADPHSRKSIKRPKFSLIGIAIDFMMPLAVIFLTLWFLEKKGITPAGYWLKQIWLVVVGYILLRLKQLVLWAIFIYQRFASEKLRRACVFEPTCSDYMYQAITKYGLIAGVLKGIKRLLRCHEPNGGSDEP